MVITNEEMDKVIQDGGWASVAEAMRLAIMQDDLAEAKAWYERAVSNPPKAGREFMAMLNKIANIDDSAPYMTEVATDGDQN